MDPISKNISIWNSHAKKDPFWAVLSHEDKKDNLWNKENFYKTGEEEIDNVIKANKKYIKRFDTALDFGCGPGRLTQALCRHFKAVYGIDISDQMINLANNENLFPDKCFYLVNQSDNLSTFKNNKFDLIYTVITLQHIPTQLSTKFIQEFIRVLKPDGVLIFQVPSEFKADVPFIRKLVWQLLQKFPDFAVSFYRQKIKKTIPIEMYPINKSDVEKIINEANGKLIDINEDNLGGSNWVSYTYIVTK